MVDGPTRLNLALVALRRALAPHPAGTARPSGTGKTRATDGDNKRRRSETAGNDNSSTHVGGLVLRLQSIPADDPDCARTALRYLVQAVLFDEFGETAEVAEIASRTASAIEDDESLRGLVIEALSSLAISAESPPPSQPR